MEFKALAKATIPDVLAEQARTRPDRVFMHFDDRLITYAELEAATTAVAQGLLALGVRRGEAVCVYMDNSPEMLFAWFGIAKTGAVYAPINTAYRGEFLRHQMTVSRASVAIVDRELADEIVKIAGELPELKHLIIRPAADGGELEIGDVPGLGLASIDDLLRHHGDAELPTARWNEPAAIIFTAGTTGPSKGVVLSHNYLISSARQVYEMRGGTESDITYGALPLFHLAAVSLIVLGPLTAGATGVLDRRFSVRSFWERVRESGATQAIALGSMMVMLWNEPRTDRDRDHRCRVVLAVPTPEAIHRPFEERFGVRTMQLYAQSEAYPAIISQSDVPTPPGYSGKPNPLLEVKLFDDNDEEVPVGTVGEFVVRPRHPHVMYEGYFNNAAATAEQWSNLWHHTGDLGVCNEEGYYAFVDRKQDYLRRRGENISSFEAEQALCKFDDVAEAAIVGVPSEFSEDDVKAYVVPTPDGKVDPGLLWEFCVAHMPYFAIPRYIEICDELPKNPVGRVEKYKLRQSGVTAQTWDAEANGLKAPRR
jgi:crotonobetaine/carnitine-CoA ligase